MKLHATIAYSVYKFLSIFVLVVLLAAFCYNFSIHKFDKVILFSLITLIYFLALIYVHFNLYRLKVNSDCVEIGNFYFGRKRFGKQNYDLIKAKQRGFIFEVYTIQFEASKSKYKFITSSFLFSENMIRKAIDN